MAAADDAQALLDTLAAALGGFAPARRFVAHNAPVWDQCDADQLTVHVAQLEAVNGRDGRGRMSDARWEWHVQIVRCVPGLKEGMRDPTVAELDASALQLLGDLETIEGTLRSSAPDIFTHCRGIEYGTASPLGPDGYRGGWDIFLTVTP